VQTSYSMGASLTQVVLSDPTAMRRVQKVWNKSGTIEIIFCTQAHPRGTRPSPHAQSGSRPATAVPPARPPEPGAETPGTSWTPAFSPPQGELAKCRFASSHPPHSHAPQRRMKYGSPGRWSVVRHVSILTINTASYTRLDFHSAYTAIMRTSSLACRGDLGGFRLQDCLLTFG